MKELEVETILQRAQEKYSDEKPRIISDNGPQFIARDFKDFIRLTGMTHVRTSPYYPQSNGKLERWHGSLTLEDTVEFFNLVLGLELAEDEKSDLVAFMRAL